MKRNVQIMKRALRSSALEKKIHKEVISSRRIVVLVSSINFRVMGINRLYKIDMQKRPRNGLAKSMDQTGIVIAIKLFVVNKRANKRFHYIRNRLCEYKIW